MNRHIKCFLKVLGAPLLVFGLCFCLAPIAVIYVPYMLVVLCLDISGCIHKEVINMLNISLMDDIIFKSLRWYQKL